MRRTGTTEVETSGEFNLAEARAVLHIPRL